MNSNRSVALKRLLNNIVNEVHDTQYLTGQPALSPRVLAALRQVPRDAFVPEALQAAAFDNTPLPIGHAQTISQPYIVALMTELLAPQDDQVVLEIGTGSGYQAAVLAQLVRQVYSVEIIPALAQQAKERLHRLHIDNVSVRAADGNAGWPEHAPFDGIIVTAAATHIPPALLAQLKPGARLVIPVGADHFNQSLRVIHKDAAGHLHTRDVLPVMFVPLTHAREQD